MKARLPRVPSGSTALAYAPEKALPSAAHALAVPSRTLARMMPKVHGVVVRPSSRSESLAPVIVTSPHHYDLSLALDRSFDHRRISAAHLIREAERWNVLAIGEAERIVTTTLADFATALDHVAIPQDVPAAASAQLGWNVERLQLGGEIGERPSGYRRRRR